MTTTTTTKATIGSISSGTLRSDHLLEAFASELEQRIAGVDKLTDGVMNVVNIIRASRELLRTYNETDVDPEWEEAASYLINEDLIDALNDYAPPFCYFGSLEGDGADFGFWPDQERIEAFIAESHVIKEASTLDRSVHYVNVDESLFIEVNDHGNITISRLEPGEILLAIV